MAENHIWIVDFQSYQKTYWSKFKGKLENFVEHAQTRALGFQFLLLDLVASGTDSLKLLSDLPDIDAGDEIPSLAQTIFENYWRGDYKFFTKTLCNRSKSELVEFSGVWIEIPHDHCSEKELFFHEQFATTPEKERELKKWKENGISLNKELLSDMTVYTVRKIGDKELVCGRHSCATSLPELLFKWANTYTFRELYWCYLNSNKIITKRGKTVSLENRDAALYRMETLNRWGHGQRRPS